MNVLIVFHSVSGNCLEIAQMFAKSFQTEEVRIRRVVDTDLDFWASKYDIVKKNKEKIEAVEIAKDVDSIWADLIIIGSPTYFGNVSAEMKAWMDSHGVFYQSGELTKKQVLAFTSCGSLTGSPVLALQAIQNFASHLGMQLQTIPVTIDSTISSPFGFIHCAGDFGEIRPDEALQKGIEEVSKMF